MDDDNVLFTKILLGKFRSGRMQSKIFCGQYDLMMMKTFILVFLYYFNILL